MSDFPTGLSLAQALVALRELAALRPLPVESLAIAAAERRFAAADVLAPIALPPFASSAMDGFALRQADLTSAKAARRPDWLALCGAQYAGAPPPGPLPAGHCLRITTGAALPLGADTVVAKEQVREGSGGVYFPAAVCVGDFVRPCGGDVAAGSRVLAAGVRLTPARIGLLAALGLSRVEVRARPRVVLLTCGDELVEPGRALAPGQIYNGNRALLLALLREEGLEPSVWPTLPDDPERIGQALTQAAQAFDLVLSCGGVSAGEKDYLPRLLAERGRIDFWKVRMRPGMPVLLGRVGASVVLGLPGNPVSALVTFLVLARPLLRAMQGGDDADPVDCAVLAEDWQKRAERCEFLRGHLQAGDDGRLWVRPEPADASYQLRGAAFCNALIALPEGAREFRAGEAVRIIRY